jgi:hypothetical protein
VRSRRRIRWLAAVAACIAVAGTMAATGAAKPAVESAASAAASLKKALKLSKAADKRSKNALKVAKRADKRALAADGKAGPAGPQGAQGAVGSPGSSGAAGPTGPTGPQGTTGLWAVIEATNTGASLVRGTATGQGRLGNGAFYVSFAPKDVTGCAYMATVGSTSNQEAPPLYATAEQRPAASTDVIVRAWDASGSRTDPSGPGTGSGFHVAVIC